MVPAGVLEGRQPIRVSFSHFPARHALDRQLGLRGGGGHDGGVKSKEGHVTTILRGAGFSRLDLSFASTS